MEATQDRIKANELRIGNYHQSDIISIPREQIHSVTIDGKAFAAITGYGIHLVEQGELEFIPIPLTREWLVRLGLNNGSDWLHRIQSDLYSVPVEDGCLNFHLEYGLSLEKEINDLSFDFNIVKVKYVHTFQNLYFALTQTELTAPIGDK